MQRQPPLLWALANDLALLCLEDRAYEGDPGRETGRSSFALSVGVELNGIEMNDSHHCTSAGSNIQPMDVNLPRTVELLKLRGQVGAISSAWESIAVGAPGPNYLNVCLELATRLSPGEFVEQVIRPIESSLDRARTSDKDASRQIDIDIILFDDQPLRLEYWEEAFMVVPLATSPDHAPAGRQRCVIRIRSMVWIVPRPEIMNAISSK
jgi:2-amino-4-hydroxy-6-hydroxymethyldihydropteridine diphosphokinase